MHHTRLSRALTGALVLGALSLQALPAHAAPHWVPATAAAAAPKHFIGGFIPDHTRVDASNAVRSSARTFGAVSFPASADLSNGAYQNPAASSLVPSVGNQGQIGSCVSWTIAHSIMGYYAKRDGTAGAPYAPLYLYMRTVAPGGAPNSGTNPEYALDTATNAGVDTEADYTQGYYNYKTAPTSAQIANAAHYKLSSWQTLWVGDNQGTPAETAIKQAISSGKPVAIGFPVFDDFEYMQPGTLYNTLSGTSLGGHMTAVFAYDSQGVWIENQWGTGWGQNGWAHLSWAFVDKLVQGAYTAGPISYTPVIVPAPTITSLSAKAGPTSGGTQVTITGTLKDVTGVTFGGVPATSFSKVTDTKVVAIAPQHAAGTVDVKVTNSAGTSATVAADRFTYADAPLVSGLLPATGSTVGRTAVTVVGQHFTGVTKVTVGGVQVPFSVLTDSTLKFTTPVHAPGAADVVVTSLGGTSDVVTEDQFLYVAPAAPAVAALSSSTGYTSGGNVVTVAGTGLAQAVKVTVAGVAVPFTRVSDTALKLVMPRHAAGDVTVQVLAPYTSSDPATYTYQVQPAPAVTGLSVSSARTFANTYVTVTGTVLDNATAVTLDGKALPFSRISSNQVRALVPAHAAGTFDLQVTTPGGVSDPVAADQFTFVTPPVPQIDVLSVTTGSPTRTTAVTVAGSGFLGASKVTAEGVRISYRVISDTQLVAYLPPHTAGTVHLQVTTPGGTSQASSDAAFTYGTLTASFSSTVTGLWRSLGHLF